MHKNLRHKCLVESTCTNIAGGNIAFYSNSMELSCEGQKGRNLFLSSRIICLVKECLIKLEMDLAFRFYQMRPISKKRLFKRVSFVLWKFRMFAIMCAVFMLTCLFSWVNFETWVLILLKMFQAAMPSITYRPEGEDPKFNLWKAAKS